MDGEKILAQAGSFYASNKRLIRYEKRALGEQLDDIPYAHLTSVGIARVRRWRLFWIGLSTVGTVASSLAILVVASIVMKSLSGILGPGTGLPPGLLGADMNFNVGPMVWAVHLLGLAIGLALVLVGIFVPNTFIQFRAPGLNKDTEARFRLQGVRHETSMNLVHIIRQQSLGIVKSEIASVQSPENKGSQATGQ